MDTLKIFTFGYYGWGNSTPQLIQAVDAVERSRGFKPPFFVDTRIQRSGRAPGFVGNLFGGLLGENRHLWMKSLGNKRITTKSGPRIQIAQPQAVNELLDLAIEKAKDRRRVIFFCGCAWPKADGKVNCHRTVVASLLIKSAKKRAIDVEVVEWPGDEAEHVNLSLNDEDFSKKYIPISSMKLCDAAGMPWGSTAKITSGEECKFGIIGPTQYRFGEWQLQLYEQAETKTAIQKLSARFRKDFGYEPIYSF